MGFRIDSFIEVTLAQPAVAVDIDQERRDQSELYAQWLASERRLLK